MKIFLVCLAMLTLAMLAHAASAESYYAYAGAYSSPENPGIQGFRWTPGDGSLTALGLMAESSNPSWVVIHASGKYLYAANEERNGEVTAFSIDPANGKLTKLNQVSSEGRGPCHLAFDRAGKFLMVANYDSGSMAVFPIGEDGKLGAPTAVIQHKGHDTRPGSDKARQEGPHAHCIAVSPDNRFVFAADLGLDQVLIYRFDAARGTLAPNDPAYWEAPPGSGPRHLAFSPDGKYLYLASEIASTVTMLKFDARRGSLKELDRVSMLPADFKGESTAAEIEASPSGKFVYASNRGDDSIAVFAVHRGSLKLIQNASTLGKEPRHFAIDPSGRYLLAENQNSNSIVVFHVDAKTGLLHPSGLTVPVSKPVCLAFTEKK